MITPEALQLFFQWRNKHWAGSLHNVLSVVIEDSMQHHEHIDEIVAKEIIHCTEEIIKEKCGGL